MSGDAGGREGGRENREQPSAPQVDVPRDNIPQPPAQIFEAPPQIEMHQPLQQAPEPQAPNENSGGIISLGEG